MPVPTRADTSVPVVMLDAFVVSVVADVAKPLIFATGSVSICAEVIPVPTRAEASVPVVILLAFVVSVVADAASPVT